MKCEVDKVGVELGINKVEIKPTHSGLRNVTDGESHIHVHLCTAQSTRRFSRLVPFCLLPLPTQLLI